MRSFKWARDCIAVQTIPVGFFFLSKKKKSKRERSSLCCVHLFTDLPLALPVVLEARTVFAGAGQWFLPSPTEPGLHSVRREAAGGKGGKSRWLNHLVMQVGDCVCNPYPLERKKKSFLANKLPHKHSPSPTPQPAIQGSKFLWLLTIMTSGMWGEVGGLIPEKLQGP